jgi:hypothetical protein
MIVKWKKAGHHLGRLSFQSDGQYRRSCKASARMGQSAVKMQLDSKAPAVVEMTLYGCPAETDGMLGIVFHEEHEARSTKHEARRRPQVKCACWWTDGLTVTWSACRPAKANDLESQGPT